MKIALSRQTYSRRPKRAFPAIREIHCFHSTMWEVLSPSGKGIEEDPFEQNVGF